MPFPVLFPLCLPTTLCDFGPLPISFRLLGGTDTCLGSLSFVCSGGTATTTVGGGGWGSGGACYLLLQEESFLPARTILSPYYFYPILTEGGFTYSAYCLL